MRANRGACDVWRCTSQHKNEWKIGIGAKWMKERGGGILTSIEKISRRKVKEEKMDDECMSVPTFSGYEDDFCMWFIRAKAYADWFDFGEAMSPVAEADLPANEGPGTGANEIAAVTRNKKAVAYLISAMPDSLVLNLMAAGTADPAWPNRAKAHLMIGYLKESFEESSILSKVRAKRDLEGCVMKKDNLKRMIQETINTMIHEYHVKHQFNNGQGGVGGYGMAAVGQMNATPPAVNNGTGITAEMMLALIQATKGNDQAQNDTSTMLCYKCRTPL